MRIATPLRPGQVGPDLEGCGERLARPAGDRRAMSPLAGGLLLALAFAAARADDEDAASFVRFVQEPAASCVERGGLQVLVKNTHPRRRVRVWLDRIYMGQGTGDRSRSELAPGAEPEPLGCSRNLNGTQEWRVVRAQFLD